MKTLFGLTCLTLCLLLHSRVNASENELAESAEKTFEWQTDYAQAYHRAREEHRWLLVWFTNDQTDAAEQEFEKIFADPQWAKVLSNYIGVRIPKSASVRVNDHEYRLLEHKAFAEMLLTPGLAILDLRSKESPYYGSVASVLPYRGGRPTDAGRLGVLLTLPGGSLTQRTLIYAVRTHRDAPRSTQGIFDSLLAYEATQHSNNQAAMHVQGHHQWDRRFQLISAKLPDHLLAQEVCAESWPGQSLVAAAEECVQSWRQSSGHWSAVSASQPRFGYDMRQGSNGIWYATGIFGNRGS